MADRVLYEVEKLLGKKLEKKQVFYLVRWKHYPPEYDTWEPARNLKACQLMFKEFDKRQKSKKSTSVAVKLLKKTKALSNVRGDATKLAGGTVRKKSQIVARQKIAAELKSKSKSLAKVGKLSKANKKAAVMRKITKKPVSMSDSPTESAQMIRNSDKLNDNTIQNTPSPPNKKGVKAEENEKKASVKRSGAKRILETPTTELKDQSDSGSKKAEQDTLDTPKPSSARKKSTKASNKVREAKTDSASKGKTQLSKLLKSESPKVVPKAGAKHKNSDSAKGHISSESPSGEAKSSETTKKVSKSKASNCEVTIISDSESDDDDILYSLTDIVDVNAGWDDNPVKTVNDKTSTMDKPRGDKISSKKNSQNSSSSYPNKTKRLSLIDFKKPKSAKQKPGAFEQLLRPSSPTPVFTPLKAVESPMLGTLPNTSLTMDSLVGDVPTVPAIPPGPLSPSTDSYRAILNNFPSQHSKGKKRKDNGNGASTSSGSSGQSFRTFALQAPIERRTSVRSVECVFRYKQIVVKKCQRYTQIWLNTQTTMKNAFNPQVVQEVVAALNTAKYDDSSLVLFSGIGSFFCSGIDLYFLTTGDRRVAARQMSDALRELTKAFITFPKPVIASVGGSAVGLGVALLCLCDIVYASDKAAFHLPYSQLLQPPEGCSSFTLPLNLGLAAANELLFGGRRITALEAYQLGLVSQVFWPTALMQEVIPRAENMAKSSPRVLENTKLLIRSHHRTKMELTNETECNLLLEHWSSNQCQHAIQAYLANENNFSS